MASVQLQWNGNPGTDNVYRYEIERRPMGPSLGGNWFTRGAYSATVRNIAGGWSRIGEVPGSQTQFTDGARRLLLRIVRPTYWHNTEIRPYQAYEYRIRAINNFGGAGPWTYCQVGAVAPAPQVPGGPGQQPPPVPPVPPNQQQIQPVIDQLQPILQELNRILQQLQNAPQVGPQIQAAMQPILQTMRDGFDQQNRTMQDILEQIRNQAAQADPDALRQLIERGQNELRNALAEELRANREAMQRMTEAARTAVTSAQVELRDAIKKLTESFSELAEQQRSAFDNMLNQMKHYLDQMKDVPREDQEEFRKWLAETLKSQEEATKGNHEQIVKLLEEIRDGLKTAKPQDVPTPQGVQVQILTPQTDFTRLLGDRTPIQVGALVTSAQPASFWLILGIYKEDRLLGKGPVSERPIPSGSSWDFAPVYCHDQQNFPKGSYTIAVFAIPATEGQAPDMPPRVIRGDERTAGQPATRRFTIVSPEIIFLKPAEGAELDARKDSDFIFEIAIRGVDSHQVKRLLGYLQGPGMPQQAVFEPNVATVSGLDRIAVNLNTSIDSQGNSARSLFGPEGAYIIRLEVHCSSGIIAAQRRVVFKSPAIREITKVVDEIKQEDGEETKQRRKVSKEIDDEIPYKDKIMRDLQEMHQVLAAAKQQGGIFREKEAATQVMERLKKLSGEMDRLNNKFLPWLIKAVDEQEQKIIFREEKDANDLAIKIQEHFGFEKFSHPRSGAMYQTCVQWATQLQRAVTSRNNHLKVIRERYIPAIQNKYKKRKEERDFVQSILDDLDKNKLDPAMKKIETLFADFHAVHEHIKQIRLHLYQIDEETKKIDTPVMLEQIRTVVSGVRDAP